MVSMQILEAAEDGNISVLQTFGREKVTENVADEFGSNCLHYAVRHGGVDVLEYLIKELEFSGNKRSNIGATPAHDAAAAGQLLCLKWLLANTACSVNDQDGCGSTVLHLACRFGHTHVTEWLLETGDCDVTIRASSGGMPLHFAVVGADIDSVKLLIDEDPSTVNLQLSNGATPTYLAAQEGQTGILTYLVQERRGNIKIKAYDGMSCVHTAAQSGHLDCVRFLVEVEKYNPNERDFDGASPLHYAASQGHWQAIHWLMKVGGARVTLDNLGGSPLHNAAESNQLQCVKALLDNGCSPDITDNNGLTAAELALKCYHDNCASLIKTYNSQSQRDTDPDLDYLSAVQSPRQPPTVISQRTPAKVTRRVPDADYLEVIPTSSRPGHHSNGHVTVTPTPLVQKSAPFKTRVYTQPDSRDETDSVLARADSSELLVGIPRSGSRDFSDICGLVKSRSVSNSSYSSLSPQEDLTDGYSGSDQIRNRQATTDLKQQVPVSSNRPGTGVVVNIKDTVSQLQVQKTAPSFKERQDFFNTDAASPGIRENKSVTFRSDVSDIGSKSIMESEEDERWRLEAFMKAVNEDSVDATKGDKAKQDAENNNRLSFTVNQQDGKDTEAVKAAADGISTNGSVADTCNGNIAEGTAQILDKHPYITPAIDTMVDKQTQQETHVATDAQEPLENGASSSARLPMVPKPVYLTAPHTASETNTPHPHAIVSGSQLGVSKQESPALLAATGTSTSEDETDAQIFPQQDEISATGSVNQTDNTAGALVNGDCGTNINFDTQEASDSSVTIQSSIPVAPPLPPPPPPPPPPPASKLAGDKAVSVNGTSMEEIKRKTASLPARPPALTAEMMQNRRSTLARAPSRQNSQNPPSDSGFLEELKKTTKASTLRRTSVDSDPSRPSVTPTMVFSAGQRKPVGKIVETKEEKMELTGEWDPKNFVDRVPNRDSLPAWKVQLQARHLAEKEMKETVGKRQVEEKEARFKNMPQWKRALIEKKEAETRDAEEKKIQEEQHAPKIQKKVPNVSVTPSGEENGSHLAPWQLELQNKP